ncbi:MAG TPA: hypothetical protein VEC96_00895 [Anaerolineae bacterium]|nr:hypothetical protein [Anaerolineae bacterium]HXV98925.1 hypothetical protein [Anaerolineae bacterium]
MQQIPVLLLMLIIMISLLIVGGLFSNPIMAFIHRRLPNFAGEDDTFLLWSGLIVAAFILGLLVMYVLLRS